ncbi:TPA: glycosyltransferase family 8 protein [Campylobacter jejuni]|nr:glycosyltransferase family 8 protein [Campylobacter jejuni]
MKNYDIVFNSSKELCIYNAVLIHSIVKATNIKEKPNGRYRFHIMTDEIDEELKENFSCLAKKLSKIYPIEINYYLMDNSVFKNCSYPSWASHPSIFYKLKVAEIFQLDVKYCLYLGTDTFVLRDIRKLFELDLEGYLIAAAWDLNNYDGCVRRVTSKNLTKDELIFKDAKYYINNDVMLINVEEWRKCEIYKKALYYLEHYNLEGYLDVFPLVCYPKIKLISNKYNLLAGHFTRNYAYRGESETPTWNYTREEFQNMLKEVVIFHFTHFSAKAWEFCPLPSQNSEYCSFYHKWWSLALNTPFFLQYFKDLKAKLRERDLEFYFLSIEQLKSEILNIKNEKHIFNSAVYRIKNSLNYQLGCIMIENSKSFKRCFTIPYKLLFFYFKYKKYEKIYQQMTLINPNLDLIPIEKCEDYEECLKFKNHLSYILGESFIKSCKNFWKGEMFYFFLKNILTNIRKKEK